MRPVVRVIGKVLHLVGTPNPDSVIEPPAASDSPSLASRRDLPVQSGWPTEMTQ
jgi:hypothetical protein